MPLEGRGLPAGQEYLPSLVQGELLANFRNFSAMNVLDRAGLPAVLMEIESGIYSPSADFGRLGEIAGADYFLMGEITATATGHAMQLRVVGARAVGDIRASFSGTPTVAEMDNFTGIRRASADLLTQMGITLTTAAMQNLTLAATDNEVRAETALARSIVAQDRGNEVEAMLLAAQAGAFNPQLAEAITRQNVLAANIQTGGIGGDVLQEIAWRAAWAERLTETERFFDDFRRENSMPFTLFYTTDIQQGQINWANNTVNLSITTHLHGSDIWAGSIEQVLNTVQEGLRATGRAQAWGFANWPNQGTVTGTNVNARRTSNFAVVFELVNAHGQVIGRQTLQSSGFWQRTTGGSINVNASDRRTLTFQNVNAHAITDEGMTVRVVTVNGVNAETAARNGVLQVRTITQAEVDRNDLFRFSRNTVHGFTNTAARNASVPVLVIPANIWGDPVTTIGNGAFDARQWGNNRFSRITIPYSVTQIGDDAFRGNHLTHITVPASVSSIGARAFWDERRFDNFSPRPDATADQRLLSVADEINITIGANVAMDGNPFRYGQNERWQVRVGTQGGGTRLEWREGFRGFDEFAATYAQNGRQAGTYSFLLTTSLFQTAWVGGAGADMAGMREDQRRRQTWTAIGLGAVLAGIIALAFIPTPGAH